MVFSATRWRRFARLPLGSRAAARRSRWCTLLFALLGASFLYAAPAVPGARDTADLQCRHDGDEHRTNRTKTPQSSSLLPSAMLLSQTLLERGNPPPSAAPALADVFEVRLPLALRESCPPRAPPAARVPVYLLTLRLRT
jgi:hypothetical protein